MNRKTLFLSLFLLFAFSTVSFSQSKGYRIEIHVEADSNETLYLATEDYYLNGQTGYTVIDSASLAGDRIIFEGVLEHPSMGRLFFKNRKGLFLFLFYNEDYIIDLNLERIWETKVLSGPADLDKEEEYRKSKRRLADKMNEASDMLEIAREHKNDTMAHHFLEENLFYQKEMDNLTAAFIRNNSRSFASLLKFRQFLVPEEERQKVLYQGLSDNNKEHPVGRRLYHELFQKDSLATFKPFAFPFKLLDDTGTSYTLDRFKDSYLFINFWAIWCDPCIQQVSNYNKYYQKWQDQPLQIVGISIDQDKEAWLSFLELNELPWINLIDRKDENGWSLLDYYGKKQIPFNVLINPEGEIVATNVNPEDLDTLISKD